MELAARPAQDQAGLQALQFFAVPSCLPLALLAVSVENALGTYPHLLLRTSYDHRGLRICALVALHSPIAAGNGTWIKGGLCDLA